MLPDTDERAYKRPLLLNSVSVFHCVQVFVYPQLGYSR